MSSKMLKSVKKLRKQNEKVKLNYSYMVRFFEV